MAGALFSLFQVDGFSKHWVLNTVTQMDVILIRKTLTKLFFENFQGAILLIVYAYSGSGLYFGFLT